MKSKTVPAPEVFELMTEIRKLTRSTLMLQHVIAEGMGLHATEAECIDFLQEMGPSTAGELAKATKLTTGAITNVIDRLEKSGFVKRNSDPNDRRKVIVTFLPDKLSRAKKHYKTLAENVQIQFSKYNRDQLKFLIQHTGELNRIYQEQTSRIEKK
jgi:DNA-binding MarR family transcriptional regulator